MKHLDEFEVKYYCLECGWKGWIPFIKLPTILKCPKCGNMNDIWKEGDPEPKRHKKLNDKNDKNLQ